MGSGFQKTLLLESGLIMGVRVKATDQVKGTTFIQASDDSGPMGWRPCSRGERDAEPVGLGRGLAVSY